MAFNLTIWYIMQTGKTALTLELGAAGYEIHFIPFALCIVRIRIQCSWWTCICNDRFVIETINIKVKCLFFVNLILIVAHEVVWWERVRNACSSFQCKRWIMFIIIMEVKKRTVWPKIWYLWAERRETIGTHEIKIKPKNLLQNTYC